ncbi:hypothetical protein TA5113_01699 [Cognatishimia activa]|nr:hypothetical protein TA5113_01699 [Cognatishimia activa]
MTYYRAIPHIDAARPETAKSLAGGWAWFTQVECLNRGAEPRIIAADDAPQDVLDRMTGKRSDVAGVHGNSPIDGDPKRHARQFL